MVQTPKFQPFQEALADTRRSMRSQTQRGISRGNERSHWTCPVCAGSQRSRPSSHDDRSFCAGSLSNFVCRLSPGPSRIPSRGSHTQGISSKKRFSNLSSYLFSLGPCSIFSRPLAMRGWAGPKDTFCHQRQYVFYLIISQSSWFSSSSSWRRPHTAQPVH